jgi:ribosomal-protein-alanine N-acetyltransferase
VTVPAPITVDAVFGDLPALETERLLLRRFTADDIDAVFEYGRDPDVARFVTWDVHTSRDDSRQFVEATLAHYAAGRIGPWAVVLKGGGVIGSAGFVTWQPEHARAEAGYALHQSYWGQGLATEALREIARFGFAVMQLNRLIAVCDPANVPSARVMEKIGMRYEGTLRQYAFSKGAFRDTEIRALLRSGWIASVRDALRIEPAREADVPEVRRVATVSWRTTYRDIFTLEFVERFLDEAYSLESLRRSIAHPEQRFLVAKDGRWVVGFCNYGPGAQGVQLYRVYVAPAYWRAGLGGRFIASMEDDLRRRGAAEYYCFVHEHNEIGKAFYLTHGFAHQAARDQSDEWCMVRRLK